VAATGCGALLVTPRPDAPAPYFVVTVPSSLSREPLPVSALSVEQQGPVPVASLRRLHPSKLDVAVVLDTSTDVPAGVYRRARRVVTALLDSLPDRARATVVVAGGDAVVLRPRGVPPAHASQVVRSAPRAAGHAWLDGIGLATDALPGAADRFAQVVAVTTGRDDRSLRDVLQVRSALSRRHVALSVVPVGRRAERPAWGDQCPPEVAAGQASAAGELLARRVTGRHVLVAPTAVFSSPLTVRLRSGVVDVSLAVAPSATAGAEPETAVRGTKTGRDEAGGRTLMWRVLLGLLSLVLVAAVALPAVTGRHRGR
jgi:hypothetical protein